MVVLLTLGKLAIAGVVDFPLPLLVLLNLSIGGSLFFLDGLTYLEVLHPLPHQLHLVSAQDTIEGVCPLFGELTAFDVELTGVVHALPSSIRPPPYVIKPPSPLDLLPLAA